MYEPLSDFLVMSGITLWVIVAGAIVMFKTGQMYTVKEDDDADQT